MPFFNFKCRECEETFEELVKSGTEEMPCKNEECPGMAEKQFSGRFHGHGLPNGFSSTRSKSRKFQD